MPRLAVALLVTCGLFAASAIVPGHASVRRVAAKTCVGNGRDSDRDGVADNCDNCPFTHNAFQRDQDKDGVGDVRTHCRLDVCVGEYDREATHGYHCLPS